MAVRLNVSNFKSLMKRGSVNFVIDNIKLIFTPQFATAAMRGTDLISVVKVPNDVLSGLKRQDEIDFCFISPLSNVLPYLDILREDDVSVTIEQGYLELKEPPHVVKISLFNPNVMTPFDPDRQPNIEFFVSFIPDERFATFVDKTKRVCATHGRIFLGVAAGQLYIRAGGVINELASEIKLNLVETDFASDVELSFNYKSFINLVGLISPGFTISVAYDVEQELGLIRVSNPDQSEVYYLMSRI